MNKQFEQTSQRPSNINSAFSKESTHDDIQRLTKDLKDYFGEKQSQRTSKSEMTPQMPQMDSMRDTPMYIDHDIRSGNRQTPTTSDTQYVQEKSAKHLADISNAFNSQ